MRQPRVILFGAFDRHNLGDLLFPHVAAALLPAGEFVFAGLAERDLRRDGGHRVAAIGRLARGWGDRPPPAVIHVGGELLTCDAWEAAVMLLPDEAARETIRRLDARPREKLEWAQRTLGVAARAPYVLPPTLFPGSRVIFDAVGGVGLGDRDSAFRSEVLAALGAAEALSVRDEATLAQLAAAGLAARLIPDPVVMVAELFGRAIDARRGGGEVASMQQAFPRGYIAVQFSADFGDDATLGELAAQLDRFAASSGFGVVFFRAGAAPWHDDLGCYRRLAARMHSTSTRVFESLNIWDICALIAGSRAYCGSSLHGRIVAIAFALPRINLSHPRQAARLGKQAAFAATWDPDQTPATANVDEIVAGLERALSADERRLQRTAGELVRRYREGFGTLCAGLI